LAKKWTIENGITLIPTSVFYPDQKDNRVFRLCFAKEDAELLKGMEKIAAIGLSAV
ncbi:MAG: hypothetical protein RL062_78, partial [Bacteroidota bacterium]